MILPLGALCSVQPGGRSCKVADCFSVEFDIVQRFFIQDVLTSRNTLGIMCAAGLIGL